FTSARNELEARLKKEGHHNDAERVKLLVKPSVSAWAVNQLYWEHRDEFDEFIATGKRLRPAPVLRLAGKSTNMRDSLDARRQALLQLCELAEGVLQESGHGATPETMRRITTSLEALSAYALLNGGPTPGRLSQDVDPPSFESLASLMIGGRGSAAEVEVRASAVASRKASATKSPLKAVTSVEARRLAEARQAKI